MNLPTFDEAENLVRNVFAMGKKDKTVHEGDQYDLDPVLAKEQSDEWEANKGEKDHLMLQGTPLQNEGSPGTARNR